jgi:hypothetical protein
VIIRTTKIDWDTDGDKAQFDKLPQCVALHVDHEDDIANYLSDTHGWCVFGVEYERDIVMLLHDTWHVRGVKGAEEDDATVAGSESDCRDICKMMVSAGRWSAAWLYPPGSRSGSKGMEPGGALDRAVIKGEPFESYTTPTGKEQVDIEAVSQMFAHIMGDRAGWIHDKYDE